MTVTDKTRMRRMLTVEEFVYVRAGPPAGRGDAADPAALLLRVVAGALPRGVRRSAGLLPIQRPIQVEREGATGTDVAGVGGLGAIALVGRIVNNIADESRMRWSVNT